MADLIDRQKAMAEAFTIMIEGEPFEIVQMETLWSLPSVDAVPVVRCKDCALWNGGRCETWSALGVTILTAETGYCNFGERRDDGGPD